VAWLGLAAPVRPRVGQLAFLAVLAFLLTTKVWSPQYSLWLVPLLALARPRWRLALAWQATEIVVWILTLTLLLGLEPNQSAHGVGYGGLIIVLLARDALLITLAGLMIREMWRPELDLVRAGGIDDPAGGLFDGAPDRFVLPARRPAPPGSDQPDELPPETRRPVLWRGSPRAGSPAPTDRPAPDGARRTPPATESPWPTSPQEDLP
jgi:uncharacterized membrane protein